MWLWLYQVSLSGMFNGDILQPLVVIWVLLHFKLILTILIIIPTNGGRIYTEYLTD